MSQTIEWAHADEAGFTLVDGNDEAADGNTPNGDIEGDENLGNIALVLEGCALYGQPADLLELLSDGIAKISAHLAGQQQ